jgi:hypothetical protein
MKKKGCTIIAVWLVIIFFGLAGWVQCLTKAISCDWDPVGKAEILYTAGVVTGAGTIIGWFDIEDGVEEEETE